MWLALLLFFPLVLAGCSGEIFRTFDADKASASIDAKQRVIISGVRKTPRGEERRIICAEPSPDAMVALAQAMSLEATVAGQGGGAVSGSLTEAVAMIGKRTATIQLLRDALYRACEAYLNGAIDDYGYALLLGQFDRLMVSMLALEGLMQLEPVPPMAAAAADKASASRTPLEGGSVKNSGSAGSATKPKAERTAPATTIAQQGTRKFQKDEIDALAGPVMAIVDYFNTRGSAAVSACLMWFARQADRQVLGNPPIPEDTSKWQITGLCKDHIETLMRQNTNQYQASPARDAEQGQRTIIPKVYRR